MGLSGRRAPAGAAQVDAGVMQIVAVTDPCSWASRARHDGIRCTGDTTRSPRSWPPGSVDYVVLTAGTFDAMSRSSARTTETSRPAQHQDPAVPGVISTKRWFI